MCKLKWYRYRVYRDLNGYVDYIRRRCGRFIEEGVLSVRKYSYYHVISVREDGGYIVLMNILYDMDNLGILFYGKREREFLCECSCLFDSKY